MVARILREDIARVQFPALRLKNFVAGRVPVVPVQIRMPRPDAISVSLKEIRLLNLRHQCNPSPAFQNAQKIADVLGGFD